MIIELLITPIFSLINGIISLLPQNFELPNYIASVIELIRKAGQFFPLDIFTIAIGNIAFWLGVHIVWAIVEWVYKKIPRCRLVTCRAISLFIRYILSFKPTVLQRLSLICGGCD